MSQKNVYIVHFINY